MADILLLNPCIVQAQGINNATITPPLGLAYLAAVLEKDGHRVQIIDANILGIPAREICRHVSFKPDLVGISVNIVSYQGGLECARAIKSCYLDVPIMLGGAYASSLAAVILQRNPCVDAVVCGEGEVTIREIRYGQEYPFLDVDGVIWRDHNRIVHNNLRGLISNLDELPFPAYHLLPDLRHYKTRKRLGRVGYVMTSRGCPSPCSFCNSSIFGKIWRPHSVERVVEEIMSQVRDFGIQQIDILDDNFTFDIGRAKEILIRLQQNSRKLHINLQNGVRVDRMDEDLLIQMKKAGVFKIGFGVESANAEVQKDIRKYVDLEKAVFLVRKARSLGIITYGFFILGLPGDTPARMKETVDFAIRMNAHFANFSICIPFPGTELFAQMQLEGRLRKDLENGIDYGFFGKETFFRVDGISPVEMAQFFKDTYRKFYFRPSKIMDMMSTIRSLDEFFWFLDVIKDVINLSGTKREGNR